MARRSNYPQLQIEVTADASGVRQGLAEVKTQIEGLNNDLKRQAAITEKTFKTASEAAKASGVTLKEYRSVLKEVETDQYKAAKSTERWVNAVKDSTAYLQGQEAVLRRRAEVLGVSADVVEREIAAYRKTRDEINANNAALRAGGRQLDQFGMTARQTSAALRQVPAQFTDIVVSLQGGQAPLTVLLQQGGQLKDVFGGVGNAVRALGGYMLTLVTPLNAVLAALAGVGLAYYKGSQEADAFNKAILLSGSYGTVTAGNLKDVAAAAVGVGVTHGAAADAIAKFVSAGVKGRESLADYAASAVKFSDTFGVKVEDIVKNFAKLGEDPLKGSLDLTKQLGYLTAATYDQIQALTDAGRASDAAKLAQSTYSDALKETVKRAEEDLGFLERLWNKVTGATSRAADKALSIGRPTSTQELLNSARQEYESFARRDGLTDDQKARGLAARQEKINALQAEIDKLEEAARKQLQLNEANKAYIQIIGSAKTPLDRQREALAKMGVELDKIRDATRLGLEGFTPERLAAAEAAYAKLAEEFAKSSKKAAGGLSEFEKSAKAGLKLFGDLTAQASGLAPDFAEKWQQLVDAFKASKLSAEQLTEAQRLLLDQQPLMVAAAKEQKDLLDGLTKEREKQAEAILKSAEVAQSNAQKAAVEFEALRNQTNGVKALKSAVQDLIVTRLEEQAVALAAEGGNKAAIEAIYGEIAARKELSETLKSREIYEGEQKRIQQYAKEWEKSARDIEKSLTDALLRSFESGKGFAKAFRESIENLFKTLVLRPTIQGIVQPAAQGVSSAFGLSTSGIAGGAGFGDILSTGSNFLTGNTINAFSERALLRLGDYLATSSSDSLAALGTQLQGSYSQLASGIGYLGNAVAGYGISKAISNGYETGLGGLVDAAGAIASAIFGPIGGVASGLVNRAFGRKLAGSGVQGTFGGDQGFVGSNFEFYKGGWFRSDKTTTSPLDQDLSDALALQFNALRASVAELASVFGVADDGFKQFTTSFKYNLEGLSEAEIENVFSVMFENIANDMAALIPGLNESAKAGETQYETLQRLATSLLLTNEAFTALGTTLFDASLQGAQFASSLIDLVGGVESFGQAVGAYYNNFYTEQERFDAKSLQVQQSFRNLYASGAFEDSLDEFTALADGVGDARAEFRALVEAQDLTTESGRNTYAALLLLAGAFAEVTPGLEGFEETVSDTLAGLQSTSKELERELLIAQGGDVRALDTAGFSEAEIAVYDYNESLRDQIDALSVAESVATERLGLERQLLVLQGDTVALRQLERDALDESNRALYDQIVALEDQQAAQREAEQAQREAEQKAEAERRRVEQEIEATERERENRLRLIASEREGLERQLLQLQGDTVALRELERNALDASNRALFDQIIALEDLAEANAEAARIGTEREGLERRLLELQGDTAALRELERNALDASNRALFDQIIALEDLATATSESEAELRAISTEREGLERRLLQLQGDTAALRELERNALDESNRSLFDRIIALEDQTAAEKEAQSTANSIASERESLERRLLELQGDTLALRQLERDALDESNQSIFDRIAALEDQQIAEKEAAAVLSERQGLERRLLQLQGDTAALRALDLEALNESNRALQEQIWAIEDAKEAQEEYARVIASVTGTVEQEIERLRGAISGNRQQSVASLQAQFALLTAQARSGDLTAAGQLAQISQAVENAAALSATSALDVNRVRAYLSSSLEETLRILGGSSVSSTLTTDPTTGAQTTIISSTPSVNLSSDQAVLIELQGLRTDNQSQASAIVNLQYKLTKIVERWDVDGLPEERVTV